MINVIDTKNNKQVATINHGFEPPKPPYDYEEQTMLDPLNRQSPMSDVFLDLFRDMVAKMRPTANASNATTARRSVSTPRVGPWSR